MCGTPDAGLDLIEKDCNCAEGCNQSCTVECNAEDCRLVGCPNGKTLDLCVCADDGK